MRVLALDHGAARCGVAQTDPTHTLVTPVGVVSEPDSKAGLDELVALVRERGAGLVVVGLPLGLSGAETEQTAAARAFADCLVRRIAPVGVELYDERLTTSQARRTGGSAPEDARAAAHLLEAWLAANRDRSLP